MVSVTRAHIHHTGQSFAANGRGGLSELRAVATLVIVFCARTAVVAQPQVPPPEGEPQSHVRTESAYVLTFLAKATQHSPTVSRLIDRINASNVIVYVECDRRRSLTLEGWMVFVVTTREIRYLRVQVNCGLMRQDLIAIIGHELQHVAEVADAPDVVDERSFRRLFRTIGFVRRDSSQEQYETKAALSIEERVRQEIGIRHNPVD
jgi:hypothetical protein